ncbi:MAG: hypothetical protein FNT29_08260 [Halothiobacillaceae bacterium]|nr:MAG: hypothetical protein FNT29_08260 [Halothiobacillaceae bacterium]
MASVSVRIDEERVSASRSAAKAEFRTVQGQVEFWAKVGRAALDNPELPASYMAESLMGMEEPREDSTPFLPRQTSATPHRGHCFTVHVTLAPSSGTVYPDG